MIIRLKPIKLRAQKSNQTILLKPPSNKKYKKARIQHIYGYLPLGFQVPSVQAGV